MQFEYTAKNNFSKEIAGTIEAKSKEAATTLLSDRDLYVTEIKPIKPKSALWNRKISLKDKIVFTQQLAVMMHAGLSVSEALRSLQEETENKRFGNQIESIVSDIEGGTPLSEAMEKFPDSFNPIYTNLVKAGESSGKLDLVLERLTGQLQKDYDLTRKVKGALSYPMLVVVALVGVMSLVLVTIIPQLKQIFDDVGVSLPPLTQFVISLSDLLRKNGLYLIIILIPLFLLLFRWSKTASGKNVVDAAIVRIPVIGTLLKKSYMARFSRTFASLTSSGLPILEALKVSSQVIGNVHYEKEVGSMSLKVKNGMPISQALKESALFPKIVGQLSTVGEKSGSLGEVFDSIADFFDRDVDSITSNLSTLLEPMILLILGIGIGGIIVSVLQPMYSLVNAI